MAECLECPYKQEIDALMRDSAKNTEQHREFYQKFNDSAVKIALAEERYTNLLSVMTEIKTSVNELKDKPNKRWETVVTCILTTIVGGLVGVVVSGLFL